MKKLYFAYGSNLCHGQMKNRCRDSKYIKKIFLKSYELFFCTVNRGYGVANIVKKTSSQVPGGLWQISKNDEKALDIYEGYPTLYEKDFFEFNNEKVMFYIIKRKHLFKSPKREYLDIINQGYLDCNLDRKYLAKSLTKYNIEL